MFAQLQNQSTNSLSRIVGVRIHRTDSSGIRLRIQEGGVPAGGVVAPVESRAPTPATAARDRVTVQDDVVGAVSDQLRVDPHQHVAGSDLLGSQESLLELVDSPLHDDSEALQVLSHGHPVRELHTAMLLPARAVHQGPPTTRQSPPLTAE